MDLGNAFTQYNALEQFKTEQQHNALAQQMNMFKLRQAQQAEADNQAMRQASQGAFNPQSGDVDISKLMQAAFTSGDIEGALKLRDVARQSDERNALRGELTNPSAIAPSQPLPQGAVPQQAPTQQLGAPMPAQAAPKPLSAYQKYTQAADNLMAKGMMAPAKQLYDLAKEVRPEMKEQKVLTDPAGKRVVVNYFKDGTQEVQPYSPDAEKLHFADTGSQIVGLDPYTNKQVGSGIRKTMTPGEIATDSRSRQSAALTRQGLEQGKWQYDAAKGVAVNVVTGQVKPMTYADGSALADKKTGGQPTQRESQAAGLGARMENSLRTINTVLESKPNVAKPEIIPSIYGALPGIGDTLGRTFRSDERQQVENAQLDALDAALTLTTGAAYTKEQLQSLKYSYFPQIGEGPQAVADKKQRLLTLIESARLEAGRAAPSIEKAIENADVRANRKPLATNKSDDWVTRAMRANPAMSRDAIMAEGKRLGKL